MRKISQNGRWGVEILDYPERAGAAEGQLQPLGAQNGVDCFEFAAAPGSGEWVLVLRTDAEPLLGCVAVTRMHLQSNGEVAVLTARPGAIWRWWGYERRSSGYQTLTPDGQFADVSPAKLLAAGVVKPAHKAKPLPEVPAVDPKVLAALGIKL